MSGHTPGPWYFDEVGNIWRRPPSELYQNGGGVAGDRPLATTHEGWYGEDVAKYPRAANARLIAAAPKHHAVALELDRLCLVIESAVRNADPINGADVLALLRSNRAAIATVTGETK